MNGIRMPSPAMAVALAALFVALGGTALAATPIVKRALLANNALKLQGRTAAQVAAMPGPAASVNGLVTVATQEYRIGPNDSRMVAVPCPSGTRAIAGGTSVSGGGRISASGSWPSAESTWSFDLVNVRSDGPAVGNVYVVCVR
jgi:hypothetical protein